LPAIFNALLAFRLGMGPVRGCPDQPTSALRKVNEAGAESDAAAIDITQHL